jgi:hypothetical protein
MFNSSNKFKLKRKRNSEFWVPSITLTGNSKYHIKLHPFKILTLSLISNDRDNPWASGYQELYQCLSLCLSNCSHKLHIRKTSIYEIEVSMMVVDFIRLCESMGIEVTVDMKSDAVFEMNNCFGVRTIDMSDLESMIRDIELGEIICVKGEKTSMMRTDPQIGALIRINEVRPNKFNQVIKVIIMKVGSNYVFYDQKLTNRLFICSNDIHDKDGYGKDDGFWTLLQSILSDTRVMFSEEVRSDGMTNMTLILKPDLIRYLLYRRGFHVKLSQMIICDGLNKMSFRDYLANVVT